MATRISATELSRSLSDILNRVHYRGEEFVIERNGETVAILQRGSIPPSTTFRALGESLAGFDFGDLDFADDLEVIQKDQPSVPPSPWPSS
jgi:hypothetical protein